MSLTTISNGASSATARANINAAITGLNNASGPNILYVTTAGDDTTGDGSLAKPYRLANKAVTEATNAFMASGAKTHIEFGVGNFGALVAGSLPEITMRGCGHLMTFFDEVTTNGSGGSIGDPGGNANNIHLNAPGICVLGNISAVGGSAPQGASEMTAGSGGNGGNITLRGVKFNGDILADGGIGGNAGTDGTGGTGGPAGTITLYDCLTEDSGDFSFAGGAGGSGAAAGANGSVKAFRSQLKMSFPSGDITLIDCITANNGSATVHGGAVYPSL
jgi:hypothetical protein